MIRMVEPQVFKELAYVLELKTARKEVFVMVESIQSSDRIVSSAVLERPIRVLHVDDDLSFLKVAKQCLEMQVKLT